jgi:hypothetical protein
VYQVYSVNYLDMFIPMRSIRKVDEPAGASDPKEVPAPIVRSRWMTDSAAKTISFDCTRVCCDCFYFLLPPTRHALLTQLVNEIPGSNKETPPHLALAWSRLSQLHKAAGDKTSMAQQYERPKKKFKDRHDHEEMLRIT